MFFSCAYEDEIISSGESIIELTHNVETTTENERPTTTTEASDEISLKKRLNFAIISQKLGF